VAAEAVALHVDRHHHTASDGNPGTADAPLASIGEAGRRAIEHRRRGVSTRIVVGPGIYREAIVLDGGAPGTASISLEGADDGVIVSGSDVWRGWTRDGSRDLFRHAWPAAWRPPQLPAGWEPVRSQVEGAPILLHGEMLFVNGRPLEQVFSASAVRQRAGTFFVSAAGVNGSGVVWAHTPHDLTRDDVEVEVALRPALLVARGVSRLTLRRLTFRHASSQLQDAAVRIDRGSDVRVEACRFVDNSWIGLGVYASSDVTVARVTANRNGAGGLQGWRLRRLTVTDTEASDNNWRGAQGRFRDWATGQKFVSVHEARFVRYRAVDNQATGLWFDTDNRDISVVDSVICRNTPRGVFLEASPGPFLLARNRICDNQGTGVLATGAARVTLERNTITGNAEQQIALPWLVDDHAATTAEDFETGRLERITPSRWTLQDNTVGGPGRLLTVGQWPEFFATLRSDRNRWEAAGRSGGFHVYTRRGAPVRRFDLDAWRRLTGQDRASVLTYP